TDARDAGLWGIHFAKPKIDVEALRAQEVKIVETLGKNLVELSKRRKVEYVRARATFTDSRTLRLDNGSTRRFKHCVIAVGASPVLPPSLKLESPRVMDSTTALQLKEVPPALLVVGGGYIGLELGCVYAALGSQVTVVEMTDGLLPGVDRDLVRPLEARLEKHFHKILLSTKVARLTESAKGIQATLEGEEVA